MENKVDIINISAGFKTCHTALRKAVKAAYASDVLIFAAAGNWGNNNPVAFPAGIRDQVICVFSTDGKMVPSNYNPLPRPNADNFSILGEEIDIGHPDPDCRGKGTSAATALATGFAAQIIDFARQPGVGDKLENVEMLRTKAGMTAIFKELVPSNKYTQYECIKPRLLMKDDRNYDNEERKEFREYAMQILEKALKSLT